jgi:hypothetical protein
MDGRFSCSRSFLPNRTLNFDERQTKGDAVPLSPLVPPIFTMNGYDLANGHGEEGCKKNHAERQERLPHNIALCNNVPDRQDRNRCTGNDADKAYSKAN